MLDLLPDVHRPRHRRRRARGDARRGADARRRRVAGARRRRAGRRSSSTCGSSTTSPRSTRRAGAGATTSASSRSRNRYSFFGPDALACEAALGFPQPVPRIAAEGWQRLDDASPRAGRTRSRRCAPRRGRCSTRWPRRRTTFLHGDSKLGNLGTRPDGRTVLVDWSMTRRGPAARRDRALPRAQPRAPPARARTKDATVDGVPRRARAPRRRHRAVVRASARAVPARRDAAARLGEGVRRDRRRARLVARPRRVDTAPRSSPVERARTLGATSERESVEQVGLLAHDRLVERLEAHVAGHRLAHLRRGERAPSRSSMSTGVPAASASSCAWHERSIVTNHHTASSTEWPTVSSPWLRRMTALLLAERVRDALALLGVEHHAGVVVEQRVVLVERARVLRERVEEAAERRPRLAVDRVRVRGGDRRRGAPRARAEWIANAAVFTPPSPSTTSPLVVHEDEVGRRGCG